MKVQSEAGLMATKLGKRLLKNIPTNWRLLSIGLDSKYLWVCILAKQTGDFKYVVETSRFHNSPEEAITGAVDLVTRLHGRPKRRRLRAGSKKPQQVKRRRLSNNRQGELL